MKGRSSNNQTLRWAIPQGSLLGPFLFTIYTLPFADIKRKHGMSYLIYDADTQWYLSLDRQQQNKQGSL